MSHTIDVLIRSFIKHCNATFEKGFYDFEKIINRWFKIEPISGVPIKMKLNIHQYQELVLKIDDPDFQDKNYVAED